jgi:hypothetical protein
MPESTELFGSIFGQLMDETKAKYIEKHANQDEWLNQALDDLAAKMSAEELEELYQKAPSAEDTAKEKLQKKIKKVKKLMKKMVKENEKDSKEYRVNERKLAGYKKELGGETTVKKKSKSLRNSRAGKEEGEEGEVDLSIHDQVGLAKGHHRPKVVTPRRKRKRRGEVVPLERSRKIKAKPEVLLQPL